MARIPNFPGPLLREHARWHMNMMNRRPRPGDGVRFLRFHRDFMRRCLRWYNRRGYDPSRVMPWSSIPEEIKASSRWTSGLEEAEHRVTAHLDSFRSEDELGFYLLYTTNLHNAVHTIGGQVFNDPSFGRISISPRSNYFYNWHGLIDNWWSELRRIRENVSSEAAQSDPVE